MKWLTLAAAVAMTLPAQAQTLYREADGNVVLRGGGGMTLRFLANYGGTPLQWYAEGFPPLLNEFPGSGASVAWRSGQDPTQASANGILANPIHRLGDSSTMRYDYYARETVFDAASGTYTVAGFAPDFWASLEALDDAIAPNGDKSDTGWRTRYQPGKFSSVLASPSLPVIFEGRADNQSGLFFVGSENNEGSEWSSRLREYKNGRIAFKIQLSLAQAAPEAFAGFMFRKSVPAGAATKHDGYMAPGIHLMFNKRGGWALSRMNPSGGEFLLTKGTLTSAQLARLNGAGLQVEVRTHNTRPGYLEMIFDDVAVTTFTDPMGLKGAHFGLFASTPWGHVIFQNRAVFDVGMSFVAQYSPWAHGIVSDIVVRNAAGVAAPHVLDRANMPAVFLNTTTFPESDRRIGLWNGATLTDVPAASYPLNGQLGLWAGNKAGDVGLLAIPEILTVDGQPATQAHGFLKQKTEGGEFVMMLNPLPPESFSEVREMRMRTRWMARLHD